MVTVLKKINDFIDREDNFLVKLRVFDVFDEKNFLDFLKLLDDVKLAYLEKDLIEKELALILCDCTSAMYMLANSYKGEDGDKISKAAIDLNEKVLNVFS